MESLTYETSSLSSPTNSSTMGTTGGMSQQQQQTRTKRMRTSFKHHQLRTMKSYFNINQNPDAKDLKQLAQKTGLSKRVLQVRSAATHTGCISCHCTRGFIFIIITPNNEMEFHTHMKKHVFLYYFDIFFFSNLNVTFSKYVGTQSVKLNFTK